MTKLPATLTSLLLTVLLVGSTACDVPVDETGTEESAETSENELRQAQPVPRTNLPATLKPDRMASIAGSCRRTKDEAVGELRYRAVRGKKTDAVTLTFTTDADVLSIRHKRNGHDLGAQRVDRYTLKDAGSDMLRTEQDASAALLLGELSTTGLLAKLPDVLKCIGYGPETAMAADGQNHLDYGICGLGWDAFNVATSALVTVAQIGCCGTTALIGCAACVAGGEIIKGTASVVSSESKSDCGPDLERENQELRERMKEQDERLREQEEWRDAEIKRRLDEEDKKAWEEFQRKQKEEEDEKAKMNMGC